MGGAGDVKLLTYSTTMSTRKPHNDLAGYVCERKSKHPKLPGYFAVFDKNKGGDWVTGTDGERWGVLHIKPDGSAGCIVTLTQLKHARDLAVDMANGSDAADLGQHEDLT